MSNFAYKVDDSRVRSRRAWRWVVVAVAAGVVMTACAPVLSTAPLSCQNLTAHVAFDPGLGDTPADQNVTASGSFNGCATPTETGVSGTFALTGSGTADLISPPSGVTVATLDGTITWNDGESSALHMEIVTGEAGSPTAALYLVMSVTDGRLASTGTDVPAGPTGVTMDPTGANLIAADLVTASLNLD